MKPFKVEICISLLLLLPFTTVGQPFSREFESIPFTIAGVNVSQPFVGGINTPNHQFVDIDGDGDLDVFIFDNDLSLDFYRNEGTKFVSNFKLRPHEITMPQVQFWFLFVDLDGDGNIDLCTDDSSSGVNYYRNDGTAQNPNFVLQVHTMVDSAGDPMFAGFSSIPAFVDLNGDSVVDFLSSNSANGSINYYQNVGSKSLPLFKLISTMFQNITVIGDTCFSSSTMPKKNAHGAGAYCFADVDGNGTPDMFYGDLFSHSIFYMENTGTSKLPLLQCTSNRYPTDGSLVTFGFNQATFADIDGDGDLDLFDGVLNNMQRHGFWYYKNTGSPAAPDFQFQTKDYLSMIDVGSYSHPTLVDIDGDTDLDLIVGNLDGQMWFFRNNGTPATPSFSLVDTMFAGISGNYSYAPTFIDIDHDGDKDLFLGRFDGHIKFYRNNGAVSTPQFILSVSPVDTIKVSQNAVPAFVDIDGDGDVDLFVGKGNGQISFYRNDGSDTNFIPMLVSTNFSAISVGENAKPTFVDIDKDGDYDLFVGNTDGVIAFYENDGTPQNAQFIRRTNHYANTDAMKEADPSFADIDDDGDLDLFVGTSKGGLQFYRNDRTTGISPILDLPTRIEMYQNYPNPFNPVTKFEIRNLKPELVSLNIFDMLGRNVAALFQGELQPGVHTISWDANGLASGIYYYKLESGGTSMVRKMILLK